MWSGVGLQGCEVKVDTPDRWSKEKYLTLEVDNYSTDEEIFVSMQ